MKSTEEGGWQRLRAVERRTWLCFNEQARLVCAVVDSEEFSKCGMPSLNVKVARGSSGLWAQGFHSTPRLHAAPQDFGAAPASAVGAIASQRGRMSCLPCGVLGRGRSVVSLLQIFFSRKKSGEESMRSMQPPRALPELTPWDPLATP